MSPVTRACLPWIGCWLLLTSVGCATFHMPTIDLRSRKATARNPVVTIVCLWEPAEGRDPNGVPCRGFAGQILFLANGGVLPVSVDGDVRVYVFDDQGTPEEQEKPLHQFDFDSGSWEMHYTYGTLGPAYNVFIPYTRRGVYESTCALRIRLTPKHGPVVFSDMTNIELLAFQNGKTGTKAQPSDPRVEKTIPADLADAFKLRKTTTISLNSQGDSVGKPELLPVDHTASPVQQAAYQTESSDGRKQVQQANASAEDRIAQLERMILEMKAQQANPSLGNSRPATPQAAPRRLPDDDVDRSRIRIRSVAEPENIHEGLFEPNPEVSAPPARVARRSHPLSSQRRHPLDDEPVVAAPPRKPRAKQHPLSASFDADDEATASIRQSSRAVHRHPLDDTFDEPQGGFSTPARVIHAEASSRAEHVLSDASDPFEPIDTDAGEAAYQAR